ncbi:MAG TPA: hypothetical protein VK753_00510 [Xanthomonadaceae bacterium]|jgi:hypothetical protein|nr:hypothetical protein [Xanthomonadaceae bacterium]
MSLFKGQMFIEDTPIAASDFAGEADAFGPSYGNRLASERQFREPWHPVRGAAPPQAMPQQDARLARRSDG